ncbi:hypothetical protein L3i22_061910 [Actinoplanes sp. L3-i22]|nr:hypothetical protein L3i22_061910 [Actinoplanes sp. L3-i22]
MSVRLSAPDHLGLDLSLRTSSAAAEVIVAWLRRMPNDTMARISVGNTSIQVDRSNAELLPGLLGRLYQTQGPPDGPDFPTEP